MEFQLRDARPIWQQLTEQMTERIITGEFAQGQRFPTVRELAIQAGVNPNTMQRALAKLEEDGLVVTNRTAGRTVTENPTILWETKKRLAEQRVADYLTDMQKLGYSIIEAAQLAAEGIKE